MELRFLVKDVSIPNGSTLELLTGGKVVLEAGDKIQIDCSVADKLSGSLSVLEITQEIKWLFIGATPTPIPLTATDIPDLPATKLRQELSQL